MAAAQQASEAAAALTVLEAMEARAAETADESFGEGGDCEPDEVCDDTTPVGHIDEVAAGAAKV
ncbi:hypothetical protein GCM10027594_32020 [Hymenobacter agri]